MSRYEAHAEYAWPDFTTLRYGFGQTMRFRRTLVTDVVGALRKAGRVRIVSGPGVLGAPDSSVVIRGGGKKGMHGESPLHLPVATYVHI